MNLILATMPDDPQEQAAWFDRLLVSGDCGALAAEIHALAGNRTERSLKEILGDEQAMILASGTAAMSEHTRRELLRSPNAIFALQEVILMDGGSYWQTLPRPAYFETSLEKVRDALVPAPVEIVPLSLARARRRLFPWFLPLTVAACLVVGTFAFWPKAEPAWGWSRPGALAQQNSSSDYYAALIASGKEWFDVRPADRASLVQRIIELRRGCSTLILAGHPTLAADRKSELVERCRKWAGQIDEALAAAERGDPVDAVTGQVDAIVNRIISYLDTKKQSA
jgi:hypothetical protein